MEYQRLQDHDLIRLCLAHSDSAWPEFVRRFQPIISSSVRNRLRRSRSALPEDVEELVQQVYLKLCENAFSNLNKLLSVPNEAVAPYLRALATNLTTDFLRKKGKDSAGGKLMHLSLDGLDAPSPEDTGRHAVIAELDAHLERCAPTDIKRARAIFWLYYRIGFTAAEIARVTVFKLHAKGVETLLQRLADCVRRAVVEGKLRKTSSFKKESVFDKRSQ